MRKFFLTALTLAFFISLSGTAMGLTVTIYTDKTEWENDLAALYFTEDLNDLLLNSGISYVSTASGHINVNFGYYQDVLMSASENEPMTFWSFTPQIIAFGGTWTLGGPGGSGNSLLVYLEDLYQPVGFISNDYDGEFWGFIADTPFTSVLLLGGNGNHQQSYKLDDMVYCPYE